MRARCTEANVSRVRVCVCLSEQSLNLSSKLVGYTVMYVRCVCIVFEQDKEMDGEGGMVENWFLAGETAMAYCSVDHLGRLVCNLHEEGVYMVREVRLAQVLPCGVILSIFLCRISLDRVCAAVREAI